MWRRFIHSRLALAMVLVLIVLLFMLPGGILVLTGQKLPAEAPLPAPLPLSLPFLEDVMPV